MSDEQQIEPSEPAGLLDTAAPEEAQASSEPEAIEHRAADSIPEDEPLERPDWWPENFWRKEENEPDLEAIAKSWTDMRKIVSQGKHKAPPEGKYDTSVFGANADDDPLAPTVLNWAKEHGISQMAFDDLVRQVQSVAGELGPGETISVEEEMKYLGPNASAKINSMVNWARGMVNKGIFSPEDFEEFKVAGGTAKGLNMLMKLRSSYEGRMPIESQPVEGGESDDELRAMINEQYYTDPAYRAKVERKFAQRYRD